jgi:hypothetical protein
MTGILREPRRLALLLVSVILAAATVMALAESYRGLYLWAHRHGLRGFWAAGWPLQADTFLVVGELALFVAVVDQWSVRAKIPAWAITLAGLSVSVAGNVGHVAGHLFWIRATAAVPPLAAAAALAIGLGVLKRVVEQHDQTARAPARVAVKSATRPAAAPARTPSIAARPQDGCRHQGCRQSRQPGPAATVREVAGAPASHRVGESRPGAGVGAGRC